MLWSEQREYETTEQAEAERDAAIKMLRVLNEETVLAGYPAGDRVQTLKNIREMRSIVLQQNLVNAEADSFRKALERIAQLGDIEPRGLVAAREIARAVLAAGQDG